MAKARSAISLGISALIVIALIIIVGFGVFHASDFNGSSVTTATQTVTVIETPTTSSSGSSLVTITEYVNTNVVYVLTHDIITNSSTTYTCLINPTLQARPTTTTSFAPLSANFTDTFAAKIVTISSNTTTTTFTTVTQLYPLTTSITTQNGSTQVVTACSAETG